MTSGNGTQHGDWDAQREQLSAYLDGELEAEERKRLEAHLVACAECQHALADLRQTRKLLRALPNPALPRSFTLPVPEAAPARSTRVAAAPRRARSSEWVARATQWVGGIAAAAGLLLLLGGALATGGPPSTGGAASGSYGPSIQARSPSGASSGDGAATHPPQIGVGTGGTHTPQSPSPTAAPTPAVAITQTPSAEGTNPRSQEHPYGLSNSPAVPLAGAGLTGGGIVLLVGGTVARRRGRRRNRRRGDGRDTRG